MPATTPAPRARSFRQLRSLALTPLLAAALFLGLGGAPVSGTAASTGSPGSPPGSSSASAVRVDTTPAYTVPLRIQGLRLTAAQVGKWYRWGYAGPGPAARSAGPASSPRPAARP